MASGKKKSWGGAIRNPKQNPGIDFYSGFRKPSQGGGGAILIPKKVPPPPVTSKPGSATENCQYKYPFDG